jgi:hypothetical protein
LDKGIQPELVTSKFLDDVATQRYQSLVGALQWAIFVSWQNINTVVMSLSSFHPMPRKGHSMDRVKRMYGYLVMMKDTVIRIRVEELGLSALPILSFGWEKSMYIKMLLKLMQKIDLLYLESLLH